MKEYRKQYYQKNKDSLLEKRKKYYLKVKDSIREHTQKYNKNRYLKKKDEICKKSKAYYSKNKEKKRQYQLAHPEIALASNVKILKKHGFPLKLDPYVYYYALISWSKTIKKLGNGTCQVCNMKAEISHHLIYKKTEPKLSLNLNNGISLCKKCHNEVHGWNFLK